MRLITHAQLGSCIVLLAHHVVKTSHRSHSFLFVVSCSSVAEMSGSDEDIPPANKEAVVVSIEVVKEALSELLNETPAFRAFLTKQTPPSDPHKRGNSSKTPDPPIESPPQTTPSGGTGRLGP